MKAWIRNNRVWLSAGGLTLLVVLLVVWARFGFTLEFSQFFAAAPREACTSNSECQHGCSPSGFCNVCPSDQWCNDNRKQKACEEWFCVGGGQPFNHCVLSNPGCVDGGDDGGGEPGKCGSNCGTAADQIEITARRVISTDGLSVTVRVGAETGLPGNLYARLWRDNRGAVNLGDYDLNKNGTPRDITVTMPSAGTWTIVIDVEINPGSCINQCDGSVSATVTVSTPPPATHLVCQNNACVTVQGAGTNECATNSDCTTPSHLVCQNNACVTVQGAGTNECADDADCAVTTTAPPSQFVCAPVSQNVSVNQTAEVQVSGAEGNITWLAPGGTPQFTEDDDRLRVTYPSAGTYTVTVSDSQGRFAQCMVFVQTLATSIPPTTPPPSVVQIPTGPGESTVLALIVSAIVTLLYVGYTSTDAFRRREAGVIARKGGSSDFK
ncbi:MAG TPA: hypothetical protein VD862_02925 [Candidatus Paceibacterota bacterium]|nr:hypothetical protein [Candidatus Paceibacterota bacterium]